MYQKQSLRLMNKIVKKITVDKKTQDLADKLSIDSMKNVKHYFPIDRFFIEENSYLEKIKDVNKIEFMFYNLEHKNTTYTIQLFVCLPELWEDIQYEQLLLLMENFTNAFSFYSLIGFTYKYLEIDLLDEIFFNKNIDTKFKKDCSNYFSKIVATFYMDEEDFSDFNENTFGITKERWSNIKEKIFSNKKIKRSLSISDLNFKLNEYRKLVEIVTE